jgi:hypothetical protein
MKTIYKFLFVLLLPFTLLLFSYNSGSPGGKTGSTGDGGTTCTQCHTGNATSQSGWISSNISADGYIAGETYIITVTGTHSAVVKMGFELTSETLDGTKIGDWEIADVARTKFTNSNQIAVTHTSAGTSPSGNTNSWTVNWTAPIAGSGDIILNAAVNAANGNGVTSGDVIYTSMTTISEAVILNPQIIAVNPDHGAQNWEGEVVINGSETMWTEGVSALVLKFHDNNDIMLAAANFTVVSNTEITANFSIPMDQQIGSYDLFVDDIMLENGFRVDILDNINNEFASSVRVYPNPAHNYINIDLPEKSEYRIVNIYGSQITDFTKSLNNNSVNISDLENGVYFIQILNNGKTISKRFIKR